MRALLINPRRTWRDIARRGVLALCLRASVALDGHLHPTIELQDGTRVPVQGAYIQIVVQIIVAIIAALVSYALTPKPPKPKPAALSEFDVPQATEGQPFCWVFGECRIPDATVAYWGGLRSQAIKSGGKK